MGFIMDGLDAESYDRSYSDWALVKRILLYFKPHFWKMLVMTETLRAMIPAESKELLKSLWFAWQGL